MAGHLIAGMRPVSGVGDVFGDSTDFIIGNLPNSIARIASIVIGGIVIGTSTSGDRFGIESHTIGSLKINGFVVPIVSPVSLCPLTGMQGRRTRSHFPHGHVAERRGPERGRRISLA